MTFNMTLLCTVHAFRLVKVLFEKEAGLLTGTVVPNAILEQFQNGRAWLLPGAAE